MSLKRSVARRQVIAKKSKELRTESLRLKRTFDLCRLKGERPSGKSYLQPMYKVGAGICEYETLFAHPLGSPRSP